MSGTLLDDPCTNLLYATTSFIMIPPNFMVVVVQGLEC